MVAALTVRPQPRVPLHPPRSATVLARLALLLLLLAGAEARAHRIDEYLQAALVAIEPDGLGLRLSLTPGMEAADSVLALIDLNRDGLISSEEQERYSRRVLSDLVLKLDGKSVALQLKKIDFPSPAELRGGSASIELEFKTTPTSFQPGSHELEVRNDHRPDRGVYLVNAIKPSSDSIEVTGQVRNENQSHATIRFNYAPTSVPVADRGKSTGRLGPYQAAAALCALLVLLVWAAISKLSTRRRNLHS